MGPPTPTMARGRSSELPKLFQVGDGRWGINAYDHLGKRKKVWLGRSISQAEAKRRYRQVLGDLTEDNSLPAGWSPPWREPTRARQRRTRYTWDAMFEHVLEDASGSQRGVLEASIRASTPHLPSRVADTTPEQLKALMRAWDEEFARGTQTRYLQTIRRGLDHAQEQGLIDPTQVLLLKAALKPITRNKPKKHVDQMPDPEAVSAVLSSIGEPWRELTAIMLMTGCRPSELLEARVGDIDVDAGGNHWLVPEEHKTSHMVKDRRIPLLGRVWKMVEPRVEGRAADDLIYPSKNGTPIRYQTFTNALRRAASKAGVREFTCYQLRHLAITRAIQVKGLLEASRLAGHANPRVTSEVYAHALNKEALAGAEALEGLYKEDTLEGAFRTVEDVFNAFDVLFQPSMPDL